MMDFLYAALIACQMAVLISMIRINAHTQDISLQVFMVMNVYFVCEHHVPASHPQGRKWLVA